MRETSLTCLVLLVMTLPANGEPTTYNGITFPEGDVSFADAIYAYVVGANVGPGHDDPTATLGAPDNTSYSLGVNGWLILEFTDNSLTASGDSTADLHIFEVGGEVEWMNIAISVDASSWIDLGSLRGQPTSIDIDAIAGVIPGTKYRYVRIADDPRSSLSGYPFGEADVDAVGAISSAPPIPVPGTLTLATLGAGLVGWLRRRRAI
jgi:hypothetical protein